MSVKAEISLLQGSLKSFEEAGPTVGCSDNGAAVRGAKIKTGTHRVLRIEMEEHSDGAAVGPVVMKAAIVVGEVVIH